MKPITRPMILIALAALVMAPGASAQDDVFYVSGAGDDYSIEVNANGYVLTSRYPKARFVEAGANARVVRGAETFYFGRQCDAVHTLFGAGRWGWANGGFGAEFDGFTLFFPRQELPEGPGLACRW